MCSARVLVIMRVIEARHRNYFCSLFMYLNACTVARKISILFNVFPRAID